MKIQRRSQALKSGWAQRVWGRKSPVGSIAIYIRKPYISEQLAAVKYFSTKVCCRVRPPSPPQNSSDLCESQDPTRPGQDGHVQGGHPARAHSGHVHTRGYATVKVMYKSVTSVHFSFWNDNQPSASKGHWGHYFGCPSKKWPPTMFRHYPAGTLFTGAHQRRRWWRREKPPLRRKSLFR